MGEFSSSFCICLSALPANTLPAMAKNLSEVVLLVSRAAVLRLSEMIPKSSSGSAVIGLLPN